MTFRRLKVAATPLLFGGTMLLAALQLAPAQSGQAQTNPGQINPAERGFQQPPAVAEQVHQGHHYIVAIGIDHYQNWPVLSTAVNDATGFAELLTKQFGFEYAAQPLTEAKATRDAINSLIDDELRSKLQPPDDLIIFFAGHGTTRTDKIGNNTQSVGFIVPFEARAPSKNEHWSDYLNTEEFLRTVSTLPAAHILVIFDSCHSGMALGKKFSSSRADTRFQLDMLRNVSRRAIASAQGDQLAADTGPLSGHSLFTGLMMQGLTSGKADSFEQGFITATQLGAYTQHEVGVQEGSRQTPQFGAFDLDDGGELIISLGVGTEPAPAAPKLASASTAASGSTTPGATRSAPAADSPGTPTFTRLESNELVRMHQKALFYWYDDNPLKDFPAARSAALKLCDANDGWGCAQAAYSFQLGLGGARDDTRSLSLAKLGCQLDEPEGCVALGTMYQMGRGGVPLDVGRAFQLYQAACQRNSMRACMFVGIFYNAGAGVSRDPVQAANINRRACDGGWLMGCNNLGLMMQSGTGTAQDLPAAAGLYRKACDGGSMFACTNLSLLYANGAGVAKDAAQAVNLMQKACGGGDMGACNYLGFAYANGKLVDQNGPQAIMFYRRVCTSGDPHGCNGLGILYDKGQGVPSDPAQAATYYKQACDLGGNGGCTNLGYLYANGRGVEKDLAKAKSLYRTACDTGNTTACMALKSLP
jgi:TPR repeat protein